MEMLRLVPKGSCPRCGHRQFIIKEIQSNLYLTGRDGEIIDSKEEKYVAVGKCTNCGKEYDMDSIYVGKEMDFQKKIYECKFKFLLFCNKC